MRVLRAHVETRENKGTLGNYQIRIEKPQGNL